MFLDFFSQDTDLSNPRLARTLHSDGLRHFRLLVVINKRGPPNIEHQILFDPAPQTPRSLSNTTLISRTESAHQLVFGYLTPSHSLHQGFPLRGCSPHDQGDRRPIRLPGISEISAVDKRQQKKHGLHEHVSGRWPSGRLLRPSVQRHGPGGTSSTPRTTPGSATTTAWLPVVSVHERALDGACADAAPEDYDGPGS